MARPHRSPKAVDGFRSGLERTLAKQMKDAGVPFEYEPKDGKVRYFKPESAHLYTPDFVLDNGIVIEAKGIFDATDRAKHQLIKQQYPELEVRFVFSRSKAPISKGSKTTLAQWCIHNGFKFADKTIPQEWLK